ncbi:MAG: dienelactone hydrolase family protein [Rhodospirillaceae bacterium]|jgi:carboxymethylenebutenolidase|nr:dienelactone hydrolase family protein [Rhodospirillaceae bacterium]MBT5240615.1 dienelactone hydrolase family protein [Rhodospirillaceae bacterium]MBT5564449.1 dienelactone hydrolase family protein [Rhodospirillaceae bacterium]MBT6089740.1 dienelactone hydrolase family protein [Rhodospirillaceae bacterium]MBT6961936.1 dienelactone hydrolase family protein [Rhodospirillaceae bacterium]
MSSQEITIKGPNGDFMGYLAAPDGGGPGVIVIQEIFGVNDWLRGVCDMLAEQGFMALAPDLFWPIEPGVQLDATVEADFNKGLDFYGKFDVDKSIEDIQAAINELRGRDGCNGKVGATGYCLGGVLTFLTAARTDSDANVGYYGVGIESHLGEADKITKPTILNIAEEDSFVPKEASDQVRAALKGHEKIAIYNYAGCDHGFARETDASHYDKAATDLAHGRTLDLFKSALA